MIEETRTDKDKIGASILKRFLPLDGRADFEEYRDCNCLIFSSFPQKLAPYPAGFCLSGP